MKLYHSPFAPNPKRVVLFAQYKNIPLELELVDLSTGKQKSEEILQKNPFGQVPILELDDGKTISETDAICLYLEEMYPEKNLLGLTPLEKAEIHMMSDRISSNLLQNIGQIFFHSNPLMSSRGLQIQDWADLNRVRLEKNYQIFTDLLSGREFIASDRFTSADITLYAVLLFAKRVEVYPEKDDIFNVFLNNIDKILS